MMGRFAASVGPFRRTSMPAGVVAAPRTGTDARPQGPRDAAAGGLYPNNPIRCARCTASARLRARSFRYSALVCSLTVWGLR